MEDLIVDELQDHYDFRGRLYQADADRHIPRTTSRRARDHRHGYEKESDTLKDVIVASTHDHLLIFTSLGRCYWPQRMADTRDRKALKGKTPYQSVGRHSRRRENRHVAQRENLRGRNKYFARNA